MKWLQKIINRELEKAMEKYIAEQRELSERVEALRNSVNTDWNVVSGLEQWRQELTEMGVDRFHETVEYLEHFNLDEMKTNIQDIFDRVAEAEDRVSRTEDDVDDLKDDLDKIFDRVDTLEEHEPGDIEDITKGVIRFMAETWCN